MVFNSSCKLHQLCGHAMALSPVSGEIIYSRFKDCCCVRIFINLGSFILFTTEMLCLILVYSEYS